LRLAAHAADGFKTEAVILGKEHRYRVTENWVMWKIWN